MIRQAPYLRTDSIATAPLFSREGGSPDWTPAFAGEQFFVLVLADVS